MKKIIYLSLVLLVLLSSCSEDVAVVKTDLNMPVEINNGVAHFKSLENYTSVLENTDDNFRKSLIKYLDNQSSYKSFKSVYKYTGSNVEVRKLSTKEESIVEDNDFLSTILNDERMVAIGDYVFKISFDDELVYAASLNNVSLVEAVKNENSENPEVQVFSTDDDVLHLLEEGSSGTVNGRTNLFCGESGADAKDDKGFDDCPYAYCAGYRQDNKVVYQKAGVYFSLQAKTKFQYLSGIGIWVAADAGDQSIDFYYKYEPKCKGVSEGSSILYDDGSDNELNKRIYESTRGLHKYRYNAYFYGGQFQSRFYEIRHGF